MSKHRVKELQVQGGDGHGGKIEKKKILVLFNPHDVFRNPNLPFLNYPARFLITMAALEGELESLIEPW